MSLLSEAMENCTMLDKRTVPDGYGGYTTEWVDGAPFKAACALMGSMQQIAAQRLDSNAKYNVITSKAINLQYHDVFRRESDKKIFRITSDGDDKKTPRSASLDMRSVDAEEWVLPT